MARETQGIAPGWYKDPADPTTQRWWDGEGWVGDPLPADATPPPGPPDPSTRAGIPPAVTAPADVPAPETIPPAHPTPPADSAGLPRPAPVQPDQPPPRPHGFPLASLGARMVARFVDIFLLFWLNVLVNGWFVYQYIAEMAPIAAEIERRLAAGESPFNDLPESQDAGTLMIIILIIVAALWFAYEVPAVANNGQTPGKRLLGIRVMRLENSQPLGFGRSFRRWNTMGLPTVLWWCYGIGFLFQLVDVLFALFDRPLRRALHDKSAHTVVVTVVAPKPPPPPPPPASPASKEKQDVPADPS